MEIVVGVAVYLVVSISFGILLGRRFRATTQYFVLPLKNSNSEE